MNGKLTLGALLVALSVSAQAQVKLPGGAAATVNGVAVSEKALDAAVQSIVQQGQKDSPELRRALKEELIARELFVQEAQKRGIEKKPAVLDALTQLKQSVLIDFLVQDELAKKPVTDQEIKAEYDRQLASLGDPNTVQQYQLRQAVFANEADAKAMIASVRGGASFAKLAKEKSIDTTNDKEGLLDWLLPGQIIPAISNVIVNLDKGAMAATPILVNGAWHVIRIEDKRPFKAPSLDESKEGIRAALLQKRRLDLLGELANKAKIIQ